jgi:uncharacterized membrane protein
MVDRSGNSSAIRVVSERVVLADWVFTTPAGIVQPATGIAMALLIGYPLTQPWLLGSIALYLVAGAAWLPVVWLQYRMRDLARIAEATNTPLDERYRRYARWWFRLGIVGFSALMVVFWLMVAKPTMWP